MKKITLIFACIAVVVHLRSQDIHYSQFFNSPLNISPGLTGVYDGNQRFMANYKNQWASVPVDYLTFSATYDAPLFKSTKKGFFAYGLLFNYDQVGDLNLKNINVGLNFSYNFRLGQQILLSPALSVGLGQIGFDPGSIRSGNQWDGEAPNFGIPPEILDQDNRNFLDLSGGLNLRWRRSYRTHIDIGGGYFHGFQHSKRFYDDESDADIASRLSLYVMSSFRILNRLDLLLNGLLSQQDVYEEMVVNGQLKLYLNGNNERNLALLLGGGIRLDDAWFPMVGLQMKQWYFSASYDFNVSDFDIATDGKGGLEIHARYLFHRVELAPFKPCPIY